MSRESHQAELKAFFDRAAAEWSVRPFDRAMADRLVSGIGLREGDRVLDLGGGAGHLLPVLRDRVGSSGRICAVDFSLEMLKRARPGSATCLAYLVCAAAETMPLKAQGWDAVICMAVFPHFADRILALVEIRRVLRPGGRLAILHAIGRLTLNALHQRIGGAIACDLLPEEEELRRDLETAGFQVAEVADHPDWFRAVGLRG